jgi:hypothetical protein
MKWLPAFLLVTIFLVFLAKTTPEKAATFIELENGCVVYAIQHQMVLQANEMLEPYLWSRVLAIHFPKKIGHAVNVFIYKGNTFVYDPAIGTYPLYERPIYDPLQLAEIIYPNITIRKAYFLEPTFLLHYQVESFNIKKWLK